MADPVQAIVLAAGSSRRMGSPKALLSWGDTSLVVAHVAAFRAGGLRVVVVVASDQDPAALLAARAGAAVISTEGPTASPFASLAVALRSMKTPHGVYVTPVDVPPAPPVVLDALSSPTNQVPVGPDQREGHPVRLDAATCTRVRQGAEPAEGLRSLLAAANRVNVPSSVGTDFDTPEAWNQALRSEEEGNG